jgi:protein O-GlcNAc transferase
MAEADLHAAERAIREALTIHPRTAALWNQLGIVLRQQGRDQEGVAAASKAVALDSAVSEHWAHLGNAHFQAHNWQEAIAAYREALSREPSEVNVWNNLASAQIKTEALAEALPTLEHALRLAPAHPGLIGNYAFLLCRLDRKEEAARWLEQRLAINPNLPEAWFKLGEVWQMMGEAGLAEETYRRTLAIEPKHPQARYQLARMLRQQRRLSAAENTVRQLLATHSNHPDGWALLGELLSAQGRTPEAILPMRQAVAIAPNQDRHARLLTVLQYSDEVSPQQLLEAHRSWDANYARPFLPPVPPTVAQHGGPLRLGFVSSDFGRHPTGFFVLPALEKLDRHACSITCYCDRPNDDDYTARFRAVSHQWRNITTLSDEFVFGQVVHDKIDILFDLMGHTGKRLLVFARKPAPLQIAWLGYVGTTGLTAIDFLLADRFHVREGEEANYSERILRMPNDYVCYQPPIDAPQVSPLPAQSNGFVTFGCFNNAAKYSPRLLETWAAILSRIPRSRLLLKANGIDEEPVATRLRQIFVAAGVSGERILIEGWAAPAELLSHYHHIDIALDTVPYSGGLTTCEALWMGVPVITCPGRTFGGRHSTSHLTNAGFAQFVAEDLTGYIDLAVQWANEPGNLAALRASMREQVRDSHLCNASQFATDFVALLQSAWDSARLSR